LNHHIHHLVSDLPIITKIDYTLGVEEGELEMFFDMTNVTEDQLVNKYLEIAQNQPYNLNWGNETTAINANYMLGVYKRNGVEYTKHP
jgi:hypothetical protein